MYVRSRGIRLWVPPPSKFQMFRPNLCGIENLAGDVDILRCRLARSTHHVTIGAAADALVHI